MMLLVFSMTAYAHSDCVFSGVYNNNYTNQSNLKLLVYPSALTSTITSSHYNSATCWNNISSNVSVSISYYHTGMPTSGFFTVEGVSIQNGGSIVYGQLIPYDINGNIVSSNSNWSYIRIQMNVSAPYNSGSSYTPGTTFIHEVGHALKLSHPYYCYNSSLLYHNPNLPASVMNQSASSPYLTYYPSMHDRYEIKYKWGN